MPRKYKPKLRFKRKKEMALRFIFSFMFLMLIAASPYIYGKAKNLFNFKFEYLKEKNISMINADFDDANFETLVKSELKNFIGENYSLGIEEKIKSILNLKWPQAENIKISYSFLGASLKIKGNIEKPVAIMEEENKRKYLLSSGKFADGVDFGTDFIKITCNKKCFLTEKKFAYFAEDLWKNSRKNGQEINLLTYDPQEKSAVVSLDGDNRVIWGDFNFTIEKLQRIKQVISDSSEKFSQPLNIDLRFFQEGKILVTPRNSD